MYNTVDIIPATVKRETDRIGSQLTHTISYTNRTRRAVTIVPRTGFVSTLAPKSNGTTNKFIVTVTLSHGYDVSLSSPINPHPYGSEEYKLVEAVFTYGKRTRTDGLSLRYEINLNDIEEADSLYVESLDILLTTLPACEAPPHPRTTRSKNVDVGTPAINGMFNLSIMIVDSRGFYGSRFVNIGGEVSKVPSLMNTYIPDGVYIARTNLRGDMDIKHYKFEDKTPVAMYPSYAEAVSRGDEVTALAHEFELERQRHKTLEFEHQQELSRIKRESEDERVYRAKITADHTEGMDVAKRRYEQRLRELDDLDKRDGRLRESQHKLFEADLKSRQDRLLQDKKNTGEWLKLVGPLISIAGLVLGIWTKAKK